MRVAVCVSGAFNSVNGKDGIIKNNTIHKSLFPDADFYYATWDIFKLEFENVFPNEKCKYFSEVNMHYHPYVDIDKKDHCSTHYEKTTNWVKKGGKERIDWTSHHTKQILIHAWLIDEIKNNYDVIVRTRFDAYIFKEAKFSGYLEDTFKNNRANCFGATKQSKFDMLMEFDPVKHSRFNYWLLDQLIIHNSNVVDIEHVNLLHEEKKLHAAEYGWYQALSMPYGSNHRNHDGWVNHDRNVLDEFFY